MELGKRRLAAKSTGRRDLQERTKQQSVPLKGESRPYGL
jgi:hypothetical protein